jgi:hypothetical protein
MCEGMEERKTINVWKEVSKRCVDTDRQNMEASMAAKSTGILQ